MCDIFCSVLLLRFHQHTRGECEQKGYINVFQNPNEVALRDILDVVCVYICVCQPSVPDLADVVVECRAAVHAFGLTLEPLSGAAVLQQVRSVTGHTSCR